MAADNILKSWALFVDGRGYVGDTEQFAPPELKLTGEDFRMGGMDAPISIDMGMEKLTVTITLSKRCADMLKLFGGVKGADVPLVARGGLESLDGTVTPMAHTMRGKVMGIKPGEMKSGESPKDEFTVDLTYYKYEQGGEVIHEVDILSMIRIVGGVDQLAAHREACGI